MAKSKAALLLKLTLYVPSYQVPWLTFVRFATLFTWKAKSLEFKVIKLDAKRNNVVVSRRAVIEEENSAERDHASCKLWTKDVEVKGIVKNLTDYGAFVDLGGVDGLLHITDMAWKRVKHPSEIVKCW